ncbi:MAG: FAD-dependent oxidoreductase [Clostridia bacterium]
MEYDAIIVGAGLAGLSCGYELSRRGKSVLLMETHPYAGGRTSSFTDHGMKVESGLHRYIGYYSALPRLLKGCGVELNEIVTWEEKVDILVKDRRGKVVLGVAPLWGFGKAVKSVIGNGAFLSWRDKLSLIPFFLRGFGSYLFSDRLDSYSVAEYAKKCGVTENALNLVVEPLSTGIFFLPVREYSAYAFFGLFAPAIPKFYKMRIGAFLGGMTELMCDPIVAQIRSRGGVVHFEETAETVLWKQGTVTGVRTTDGRTYRGRRTVIAAPLSAAKTILSLLKEEPSLASFFRLPEMSSCTVQLELDAPALEKDITTFGPGTDMVSFAEQSRTVFPDSPGRLSVILGHPERYIRMTAEEILKEVIRQMTSLGVSLEGHILDTRKVAEEKEFYSLAKGNQRLRPSQKTAVPGLVLAGDYTKTSSFATMEGAVISGRKAAKVCLAGLNRQELSKRN